MTRGFWLALALGLALTGCGASDPPRAAGGIDLSGFWRSGS